MPLGAEEFTEPEDYLTGIEEALFGELAAFEIITDELKHASKYNFIYTRNYGTSPTS